MGQGLLLWYVGNSSDPAAQLRATEYLERPTIYSRLQSWPGPAVLRVLGRVSFEDLLSQAAGKTDLEACIIAARSDLFVRRQLCLALFYDGAWNRSQGRDDVCEERMRQCYSLRKSDC